MLFHFMSHVQHYYNLSPTKLWKLSTVLHISIAQVRNNLICPSTELFELQAFIFRQVISNISFRSYQFNYIINESLRTTECMSTFLTALRGIIDSAETTLSNRPFLDQLLKNFLLSHPSGHDLTGDR